MIYDLLAIISSLQGNAKKPAAFSYALSAGLGHDVLDNPLYIGSAQVQFPNPGDPKIFDVLRKTHPVSPCHIVNLNRSIQWYHQPE